MPFKIGKKLNMLLYFVASLLVAFAAVAARLRAQGHEHVLGKEYRAVFTGSPIPFKIGKKLNMLLWLSR